MPDVNPLLFSLAEARHMGDRPETALLKVFMTIMGDRCPLLCIPLALLWEQKNGPPTYETIETWCRAWAADPANADLLAPLRRKHERVMASFSPAELAEMAAWMPEATDGPPAVH